MNEPSHPKTPGEIPLADYTATVQGPAPRRRRSLLRRLAPFGLVAILGAASGNIMPHWEGWRVDGVAFEDAVELLSMPETATVNRRTNAVYVVFEGMRAGSAILAKTALESDQRDGANATRGLGSTAKNILDQLRELAEHSPHGATASRVLEELGESFK